MNVAFIFGPNSPRSDLAGAVAFYEQNAAVRRSFDQAAEWTGLNVDCLLGKREFPEGQSVMRLYSVILAAVMLGIQDALAELGVMPSVVGGLSLGGVVSTCAGGALTRRQLFDVLRGAEHGPAVSGVRKEEAIAFVFVPADQDPSYCVRPRHEGVFLGMDCGMNYSGDGRAFMLAGYREDLEEFARCDPHGNVRVRRQSMCSSAYHTPIHEHARAPLELALDQMHIKDPAVPVCSGVIDRAATTAADIRKLILHNTVQPVQFSGMTAQLVAHGARIALAIGPSMTRGLYSFPFPVIHVDAPENLAAAVSAIAQAGLELSGSGGSPQAAQP